MNGLTDLIERQRQAVRGHDLEGFIATIDPGSPMYEGLKLLWRFYLEQNRIARFEYDVTGSTETGAESVELAIRMQIQCEGFGLQHQNVVMRAESRNERWICTQWNRTFPVSFGVEGIWAERPAVISAGSDLSRRLGAALAASLDTVHYTRPHMPAYGDVVVIGLESEVTWLEPLIGSAAPSGQSGGRVAARAHAGSYSTLVLLTGAEEAGLARAVARFTDLDRTGPFPESLEIVVDSETAPLTVDAAPVPVPEGRELPDPWAPGLPAAAEPDGPEAYARTVLRRYRWLQGNAQLASALIVANMMSEPAMRLAWALHAPTLEQRVRNIHDYVKARAAHMDWVGMPFPWPQEVHGILGGPRIGHDELLAFGYPEHRLVGICDPLQVAILAQLRLAGVPQERIWEIGVVTDDIYHDISIIRVGDRRYLCSNNSFVEADRIPYHNHNVIMLCNDNAYWVPKGRTNIPPAAFAELVDELRQACPSLTFDGSGPQPAEPRPAPLELDPRQYATPAHAARAMLEQVFRASGEPDGSLYIHARYALQTLWVRQPEAYMIASRKSPVIQNLARELTTPEAVLAWVSAHVRGGSIFTEPHRIMHAEQVCVHRRGGAKEKALLAAALLGLAGIRAYTAVTTAGGYLLYQIDGRWHLLDMDAATEVKVMRGHLTALFSDAEAYHPWAGRYQLPADVPIEFLTFA